MKTVAERTCRRATLDPQDGQFITARIGLFLKSAVKIDIAQLDSVELERPQGLSPRDAISYGCPLERPDPDHDPGHSLAAIPGHLDVTIRFTKM